MSPPEAVEATVNDQEDYLAKKYAYNDGLDVQGLKHNDTSLLHAAQRASLRKTLAPLYSESASAKIWSTATKALDQVSPPKRHPEYTAQDGHQYVYSSHEFWTSGFFPGCLALLYERQRRWGQRDTTINQRQLHPLKLQHACHWWSDALHAQATRRDTHDLGFVIQPWAQILWELDGDKRAFGSLTTAAYSLASRFDARVGAIRSWDTCFTKRYHFDDPAQDFLVIIDSMMNLNLLYYVAHELHDDRLADIATKHARTLMQSHVRGDNSTWHVVNFDQDTAKIKRRMTNQGYSDDSCWARGQAWGITGYAQTYGWTGDPRFLDMSCRLADYFIDQLPDDHVPVWDFSRLQPGPKDTSAALVAVYGMLLLHQHLHSNTNRYLSAALRILEGVLGTSMAAEARFCDDEPGSALGTINEGAETIVLHATINNYEFAPRRFADHGLVYADYYFLLIGNELLRMGIM